MANSRPGTVSTASAATAGGVAGALSTIFWIISTSTFLKGTFSQSALAALVASTTTLLAAGGAWLRRQYGLSPDAVSEQMQRSEHDQREIVNQAIKESIVSLSRSAAAAGQLQSSGQDLIDDVQRRIDESIVTIELSKVAPGLAPLQVPAAPDTTVTSLLNSVYFAIAGVVKPYTYNRDWVLIDQDGLRLKEMGTQWARAHGVDEDRRTLGEAGINPGSRLMALQESPDR
jgi:hypothetical protein